MNPWELIVQQPITNILIVMTHYIASNFGLAIIILTMLINLAMLPLTIKQIKTTQSMQSLQPKLAELQKKYGKDKQKFTQEQMKLYKESGMSPVGCLVPMLVQMPIWLALYQSIMLALAVAPEGLLNLSRYLYSWPIVYSILPLGKDFLWLNLADPDMIMAILVGVTMWIQQKMTIYESADPRQSSQTQMMLWTMPLMFTFLALSFPSGLSLYWVTSSIFRIAMQYYSTGLGGLAQLFPAKRASSDKKVKKQIERVEGRSPTTTDISADIVEPGSTPGKGTGYGKSGGKRQDRGGGDKESPDTTGRQSGRGRSNRNKRG